MSNGILACYDTSRERILVEYYEQTYAGVWDLENEI